MRAARISGGGYAAGVCGEGDGAGGVEVERYAAVAAGATFAGVAGVPGGDPGVSAEAPDPYVPDGVGSGSVCDASDDAAVSWDGAGVGGGPGVCGAAGAGGGRAAVVSSVAVHRAE